MMLWVIFFRWHGSIVVRVTNLDVRNAQRWIRGFRHSVVQKRCSEDMPVPCLPFNFKNHVGKVSGYSEPAYKHLSDTGSWESE